MNDFFPNLPSTTGITPTENITILALDQSGSMGTEDWKPSRMAGVQEASLEFLYGKYQCEPTHVIAVVGFDHQAHLHQKPIPVLTGLKQVEKKIKRLSPGGGTDINKALKACIPILFPYVSQSSFLEVGEAYGKRSILLVTDGEGGDPYKTAFWLKNNEVRVECIGVGGSPRKVNEPLLQEIASVENKRILYRFIGDKQELVQHFGALARTTVAYLDPGEHTLQIYTTAKGLTTLGTSQKQWVQSYRFAVYDGQIGTFKVKMQNGEYTPGVSIVGFEDVAYWNEI